MNGSRRPGRRASRLLAATLVAGSALAGPGARVAQAGETQDAVTARWRGAWVVTTAETYSDCLGVYSNNRINGKLVTGRGHVRFKPGELAKVDSVDLKRNRIDLRMTLEEPFLVPRPDGPFTLFDQVQCRMELQVEVARDLVKQSNVGAIDEALRVMVERYAAEPEARASKRYNGREVEPFPEDYEKTVRAHAAWRARQTNAQVQARIDALVDETSRISDRIGEDHDYLAGFGKGAAAGRAVRVATCAELMQVGVAPARTPVGAAAVVPAGRAGEAQARFASGYSDGLRLSQQIDAVRRLPGCFVPVPED